MNIFTLLFPYFNLAAGLAALVLCGNWLVTGGIHLAQYFKISKLIVGLTIIAFGTSAPELFVSMGAAFKGAPDIALGNVIGSNIANIALVIGFTAIIFPILVNIKSVLFDLIFMLAATILLFFLGYNGTLGHIEGICFVLILISYILLSVYNEKKKNNFDKTELKENTIKKTMNPLLALLLIAISVTGLYFGSEWFINGARQIAEIWGVSERVIGISIVALGTSMPELVTSVIAAIRKETDISVGNIIGSNIFNITMVLGITATIKPLNIADIPVFNIDMLWVFGIAVLLLLAMLSYKSESKIYRWKGCLLLALYAIYIFTLFNK